MNLFFYILWHEPSHGYFGGRVEDEGLADGAEHLSEDDEGEVRGDEAAEASSDGREDRTDDHALANALDVEHPVRWEVGEDVDDHVRHRDDGYNCVGLVVGAADGDGNGRGGHPAHTVDES